MRFTVLVLGVLSLHAVCFADIYIDGRSVGTSYTLAHNVRTVVVDGGTLILGNKAGIHQSLQLTDGTVIADERSSGNINGRITVSGGEFVGLGSGISYSGGFAATGGVIRLSDAAKLNKTVFLYGDAAFYLSETVEHVKSTFVVEDHAKAFFGPGFSTNSQINRSGKVVVSGGHAFGWVQNDRNSSNFSVSNTGSVYVGVIPEPATISLIGLVGLGAIVSRRIFGRGVGGVQQF